MALGGGAVSHERGIPVSRTFFVLHHLRVKLIFKPGNTPEVAGIDAISGRFSVLFVPGNPFGRGILRLEFSLMTLSDIMLSLVSFRKSTSPQNRQLDILISNSKH